MDKLGQREIYSVLGPLESRKSTCLLAKALVRVVMTYAFQAGYIDNIPDVKVNAKRPPPVEPWDDTELRSALKLPNKTAVTRCMFIAYHTAQRVSDILSLTWDKYDGANLHFKQRKTGLPIKIPCTRALKRMLDQAERRGDYIIQVKGKPLSYKVFYYNFRKEFPKSEHPTFHSIRHAAASKIASMGASPHEIMSITGHRSISSVQRYTQSAQMWKSAKKIMDNFDKGD